MTTPAWRKSSRSVEGTGAQCVEVARLRDGVGVRDGKAPEAGHLDLDGDRFAALIRRIKNS